MKLVCNQVLLNPNKCFYKICLAEHVCVFGYCIIKRKKSQVALEKFLSNFILSLSNKYRTNRRKKTFLDRCTEFANDIFLITYELTNEITIKLKNKIPAVKIF